MNVTSTSWCQVCLKIVLYDGWAPSGVIIKIAVLNIYQKKEKSFLEEHEEGRSWQLKWYHASVKTIF